MNFLQVPGAAMITPSRRSVNRGDARYAQDIINGNKGPEMKKKNVSLSQLRVRSKLITNQSNRFGSQTLETRQMQAFREVNQFYESASKFEIDDLQEMGYKISFAICLMYLLFVFRWQYFIANTYLFGETRQLFLFKKINRLIFYTSFLYLL